MRSKNYFKNAEDLNDSLDESDDYSALDSDTPIHSPIRRKEKFRPKDYKMKKKHKDHKRNLRNIRDDFKLWEQ